MPAIPKWKAPWAKVGAPVTLVQNEADVAEMTIPPSTPVAYITQTTLSIDDTKGIIVALKKRFSDIVGPRPATFATPPRTARPRCANWPRSPK
jgi:4-hydroxy-3-methylbut-2-enyl diphosphate reductase